MTVSVKQHEYDKVTRCTFSVDFKEIKRCHSRWPARAQFVYSRGRTAVTEERLGRLGYLEPGFFEYEFRYIIS